MIDPRRRACLWLHLTCDEVRLRGVGSACTLFLWRLTIMKFVKRRSLWLILISLCAACYARAQTQVSQADAKAFVTQYVAAYNSKDAARLQGLYDSKSRACFTGEGKDFYDCALAAMWRDPIPAKYTFKVSALNEINMKAMESFGRFALKPTRELHIDYQQGDDLGSVIVYLVQENGRWRADQPCASEQSLKEFRDERRRGKSAKPTLSRLPTRSRSRCAPS